MAEERDDFGDGPDFGLVAFGFDHKAPYYGM